MGLNKIFNSNPKEMKQICTLIVFFCLFIIAQNSNAQSCTFSFTNPNPALGFGAPLAVDSSKGFTTNPGTITGAFPKMKTTSLFSPAYHYAAPEDTIYFDYNFTKAQAGSTSATPTITILYGTNFSQSFFCTSSSAITIPDGTNDLYFGIIPSSLFPAGTDFKIEVTMTLTNGDKAVVANTLRTNAILSSAAAPLPSVLPVTFSGFYARKVSDGVSLTWNVATEINLSGYEVQRSTDGMAFSKIGFVSATNASSYNFTDSKALDAAYYRIKSIDLDGKYAYSTVIAIKGQQSGVVMKAFPMPVQNQLTIQHTTAGNNSKIEVITADGRLMKSISVAAGMQQTNVDMSSAKAGIYVVHFVNDSSIETLKIVKQ